MPLSGLEEATVPERAEICQLANPAISVNWLTVPEEMADTIHDDHLDAADSFRTMLAL
jgi:hypothetical protein